MKDVLEGVDLLEEQGDEGDRELLGGKLEAGEMMEGNKFLYGYLGDRLGIRRFRFPILLVLWGGGGQGMGGMMR